MNKNLLIVGAGVYGLVAKEIAESLGCFERIAFVDDKAKIAPDGTETVGRVSDIKNLVSEYGNVIVAIGNPEVRLGIIERIAELPCKTVSLVSPLAYVSYSAQLGTGCIIEPMAVVHTKCVLGIGCIVSAGAVINHDSTCCDGVHVDCNATVEGYSLVPTGKKIHSGEVYKNIH